MLLGMLDTSIGLPAVDVHAGGDDGLCFDCEHNREVPEPRLINALRGMFGKGPRVPECQVRTEDVSGIGSLPCGCRHRTHRYTSTI